MGKGKVIWTTIPGFTAYEINQYGRVRKAATGYQMNSYNGAYLLKNDQGRRVRMRRDILLITATKAQAQPIPPIREPLIIDESEEVVPVAVAKPTAPIQALAPKAKARRCRNCGKKLPKNYYFNCPACLQGASKAGDIYGVVI